MGTRVRGGVLAAALDLMLSTILHVEDDLALRGLVNLAFESFGFRGTFITAGSVEEATKRLEQAASSGERIDLIISDMNLPDGTGLEIVRDVRASSEWRATPVLILSGDVNPRIVGKAYALGANAYLDKSPRGRPLSELLRSLYQHWTHDVVLLSPPPRRRVFIVSSCVRCRSAAATPSCTTALQSCFRTPAPRQRSG